MKEIEVTCKLGKELTADEIQTAAVKALGVSPKMKSQLKYRIVRRSIDARNDIIYRYRVEVCKPDETLEEYVLDEYKNPVVRQRNVNQLRKYRRILAARKTYKRFSLKIIQFVHRPNLLHPVQKIKFEIVHATQCVISIRLRLLVIDHDFRNYGAYHNSQAPTAFMRI